MNALIPMEAVSTIVPIQLAVTIAYVLLVILLTMTMITVAHVRSMTLNETLYIALDRC